MPPESNVRYWVVEDREGFSAQYARARDVGLDCMADELVEVADDRQRDPQDKRVSVDARKWYLGKLAPKRYGDKLAVVGPNDGPIQQDLTHGLSPEAKSLVIDTIRKLRGGAA